jgi:hypothetical protein
MNDVAVMSDDFARKSDGTWMKSAVTLRGMMC